MASNHSRAKAAVTVLRLSDDSLDAGMNVGNRFYSTNRVKPGLVKIGITGGDVESAELIQPDIPTVINALRFWSRPTR